HFVLPDRTAERPTHLLVRIRQHALRDEVGGVETIVAKIAVKGARIRVGAGLRHRVHRDAARAPPGRVESRGYHLELTDCLTAELWLNGAARLRIGHLLAIHEQLERDIRPVTRWTPAGGDRVVAAARRQER